VARVGGAAAVGVAGTANTGGGGGGASNATGGNGGSGVVILRYPSTHDITVGAGLTCSDANTVVDTTYKYATITEGTGSISFAVA